MLKVNKIYFDYFDKPVLKNVNFTLSSGELLHIKGANGSGKTTLLKLIANLIPLQDGQIIFDNNCKYCFVGHKPGLARSLTIKEHYNLELFAQKNLLNFNDVLNELGLLDFQNALCSTLSSGQLRKVSLLKIFFTHAKLWLLDEPFTALDEKTSKFLLDYCNQHLKNDGAIIMTSHQLFDAFKFLNYKEYNV